jgi:hypothetical protein
MTKKTFDLIQGFSLDYAFGNCFDDNDLLLKIELANINFINVRNDIYKVAGIHQYHGWERNNPDMRAYHSPSNKDLFYLKKKYAQKHKQYIEISEGKDVNEMICLLNKLFSD